MHKLSSIFLISCKKNSVFFLHNTFNIINKPIILIAHSFLAINKLTAKKAAKAQGNSPIQEEKRFNQV
jgi:hypothetical protein